MLLKKSIWYEEQVIYKVFYYNLQYKYLQILHFTLKLALFLLVKIKLAIKKNVEEQAR